MIIRIYFEFICIEVLLEPMRRYRVTSVTKEDSFDIIQLEPMGSPLFLENEIPGGCIQHIITNILKYGRTSKDLCDKMCNILCRVHMDDADSRKISLYLFIFI